ncbi:MAG: MFS transporter [Alphaproteobacteria bacterium]
MTSHGATKGAAIRVVLSLYALYLMSMFYRSTNAVLAPVLRAEMGITADQLGLLTGTFFIAFAVMQIPLGLFLDRFGPRVTIAAMMLVPAAGAVVFSQAQSVGGLALGQGIMGAGCAVGLSGAIVVFVRWFPTDRIATMISLYSGMGNVGILLSATPLAASIAAFGWRDSFLFMAVINVILVAQMFLMVRDAPPDHPYHGEARETLGAIFRGLGEVLATRAIWPMLALAFVSLSMVLTIRALWAGPYLADVFGLDAITRGNMLLVFTIAMLIGNVGFGPLDRLFDRRKPVVLAGAAISAAALAGLALFPALSLWAVMAFLCVLGVACNYVVIIFAHGRALFPVRLVGRAITLVNGVNMFGIAVMQVASGYVIRGFPATDGAAPEIAYRAMFGFLAICLVCGMLVYTRSRDIPPSAERAGE